MKPEYLDELIDRASQKAGNDTELARDLEVGKSLISDWRHGRKTCSPEDQALMADIAGLDAEAWAARALIAKHAGTTRGAKLEAALKKALLATGAAMLTSSVHAQPVIDFARSTLGYLIRCINCQQKAVLATIAPTKP